jgi:hypothetical protein
MRKSWRLTGSDHSALHLDSVLIGHCLGNLLGAAPSPRKQTWGVGKALVAPRAALPQEKMKVRRVKQ